MSHCASTTPTPPTPPPPTSSLPLALLFSLSLILFICHLLTRSLPPLFPSVFCARLCSISSEQRGVKQRPVCSQALLIPASSYLLVSWAAVTLLCVTAQPCLFSLTGSCLSWLWTSFKTCPVSAPRQTHTRRKTHWMTCRNFCKILCLPVQAYNCSHAFSCAHSFVFLCCMDVFIFKQQADYFNQFVILKIISTESTIVDPVPRSSLSGLMLPGLLCAPAKVPSIKWAGEMIKHLLLERERR